MRISIVAVGRLRPGPEAELIAAYTGRLDWRVEITEVDERRPLTGPERQASEARLIAKALPPGAPVVALDERGELLDSPAFARMIGRWQDNGTGHIVFVIGGASGLAPEIRGKAQSLISFGRMTWPHMLARVMLTEQLYRAVTILGHHPYHK